MGNVTNSENWSARARLVYIERIAYWRGFLRRADISKHFGVSVPQASADIAEYLRINPGSLDYDRSAKRYVATKDYAPKLWKPEVDDGFAFAQGSEASTEDKVTRIDLPNRHVSLPVLRAVVRAVSENESLRIYYYSVNSGTAGWRWITPRAFANDGYRWHARAWCFEDNAYKDFVLGRIEKIGEARPAELLPTDKDWDTWVTVRFKANAALSPIQQQAVQRDFAMRKGVGSLRVRKALMLYTLVYLGLAEPESAKHRRLELVSG
jgi:predicted DNA-binding transcriptional regulator YafY